MPISYKHAGHLKTEGNEADDHESIFYKADIPDDPTSSDGSVCLEDTPVKLRQQIPLTKKTLKADCLDSID